MKHSLISLNDRNEGFISYSAFGNGETNSQDRVKMKDILRKAIQCGLTSKQKYCICEYYFKGKSMKDIAKELNVNPSTVTRHIQRAKTKLQSIAQYY